MERIRPHPSQSRHDTSQHVNVVLPLQKRCNLLSPPHGTKRPNSGFTDDHVPRGVAVNIGGFHPPAPGSTPGAGAHFFRSPLDKHKILFSKRASLLVTSQGANQVRAPPVTGGRLLGAAVEHYLFFVLGWACARAVRRKCLLCFIPPCYRLLVPIDWINTGRNGLREDPSALGGARCHSEGLPRAKCLHFQPYCTRAPSQ